MGPLTQSALESGQRKFNDWDPNDQKNFLEFTMNKARDEDCGICPYRLCVLCGEIVEQGVAKANFDRLTQMGIYEGKNFKLELN